MAIIGGAGNPVGGSFTGPAEALEIIGDHAYAYSGAVTTTGTGSANNTTLKFTSGNYYFVGTLTFYNDEVGGPQQYVDMQLNGNVYLGQGPCMSMYSFHGRGTLNGLIPHPKLVKLFEEISKKNKINLQRSASTGILTDSSYVQLVEKGIASIDIGFPMRYSHSSKEVCDLRDLLDLENLLFYSITSIDKNLSLIRS